MKHYDLLRHRDGSTIVEARLDDYRARLKAGADPALWPAAHVEAEHMTPAGWREVRRPETLIALHRLLTAGLIAAQARVAPASATRRACSVFGPMIPSTATPAAA